MKPARRLSKAAQDGPCHSWSFAIVALALAAIALYVGTGIAASLVSAHRNGRAVAGMVGYYGLVLGGPGFVAHRTSRAGKPRCAVICRGAITCLVLHLFFTPFLGALVM